MKTMDEWVEELKSWDMPVLQRSVRELGKLAGRAEQITAGEIADVVLRDPLMTLKVLRLVNGMSRSRLSNEITTVEHAVMMLGVGPFFNRLSNLKAVEESLRTFDGALPGLMQAMSRAHHAAWQARDWAIFRADMKSEEVYIGALLYDMGEILLWAYAPEQALQIRKLARRNKTSLAQAQKEILGFDSRELQFALAEAWRLPELMQAFMHSENAVQPRILGVTLAASVARLAETGWYAPQLLADYEVIAGMLHMHLDEVVHMVHHNAVVEARHWDWYGVPPAAALLPMLPGDWPEEPGEVEETPQPEEEHEVCMMPQPDQAAADHGGNFGASGRFPQSARHDVAGAEGDARRDRIEPRGVCLDDGGPQRHEGEIRHGRRARFAVASVSVQTRLHRSFSAG